MRIPQLFPSLFETDDIKLCTKNNDSCRKPFMCKLYIAKERGWLSSNSNVYL